MPTTVQTPSTGMPITVQDLKVHMRVFHNEEDALLEQYIRAATNVIEQSLDHVFLDTAFRQTVQCFTNPMNLERAPLQTLTSIEYYDEDDVLQTLAATEYRVIEDSLGIASIYRVDDWPSIKEREDAVRINYTAGYGTTVTDIPERAKQAVLLLAAHFSQQREPVAVGTIAAELPWSIRSLMYSLSLGR